MRILSAAELLGVWERGMTQPPVERALELLGAACPELSLDALAKLTIGQRDSRLLTLRGWIFGPQMAGVVACPRCAERLELSLNVAGLQSESSGAETPAMSVTISGYEARFRPPNSADLEACAGLELAEIRARLLTRCVIAARSENGIAAADQLPADVAQAIITRMADADPHADIRIDVSCSVCHHRWRQVFDIVSFFWSEIDAWARRILREVHMLASTYGWNESDILALTPCRRRLYLEMAGA